MNPPAKKQKVNSGVFRVSFDALFNNLKKQLSSIEDTQFINGPKVDVRGYLWQIRLHKINKNVEVVLVYMGPLETCSAQFDLEFEPNLGFGKESFEQYTYTANKTSEYMCIFDIDHAPDSLTVKVKMEIVEERTDLPESLSSLPSTSSSTTSAVATVTPTASVSAAAAAGSHPVTGAVASTTHVVSFAASATSTSANGVTTTHLIPPPPPPPPTAAAPVVASAPTPAAPSNSSHRSSSSTVVTTINALPIAIPASQPHHLPSSSFIPAVSPRNEPIMYRLYRERSFSDCSFLVAGKSVPAHRFVLCYGSRVFRHMFCPSDGKPSDNTAVNDIAVVDTSLDVFELFLKYLYTHQCDSSVLLSQCAPLLDVAAKYQVDGLVNICVNHMIAHKGIHTATDILLSAEQHGLVSVKRAVISFIVANMKRMTKETDMLSRLDTKLKDEIIRSI